MSEKRDLQKDLEICEAATPGPWWTDPANTIKHDRSTRPLILIACRDEGKEANADQLFVSGVRLDGMVIDKTDACLLMTVGVLLDKPEDTARQDQLNATFIAEARLGWPHAITRALAAEARVEELEGRKCETCEWWDTQRGIELNGQVLDGWHECTAPNGCVSYSYAVFACSCWKKRGGE